MARLTRVVRRAEKKAAATPLASKGSGKRRNKRERTVPRVKTCHCVSVCVLISARPSQHQEADAEDALEGLDGDGVSPLGDGETTACAKSCVCAHVQVSQSRFCPLRSDWGASATRLAAPRARCRRAGVGAALAGGAAAVAHSDTVTVMMARSIIIFTMAPRTTMLTTTWTTRRRSCRPRS